ncbi:MAG TPA: Mur ligase family protein, partial [Acidimicrobiales bacterium]
MRWSDLRDARVAVWGLGVEGRASVARLVAMGTVPELVDDRPTTSHVHDLPVHATDDGGLERLQRADVVVKSPGISRYRADVRALADAGVAVVGGLGLWLEEVDRSRVVLVTGTKGKSTTTSIIGHLLRRLGLDCFIGGNLGLPPFAPEADAQHDAWVVEVSSYQATDLTSAPPVVAVTSLSPDHLNWHDNSVEQYYRDKLSICRLPGAQITVADGSSDALRERRDLLGPEVRWVTAPSGSEHAWSAALGLRGAHNARNAEIARRVLDELGFDAARDEHRL